MTGRPALEGRRPALAQWTVKDGYSRHVSVYENEVNAIRNALIVARSDRPTLLTQPDGKQFIIIAVDPAVHVVAQRDLSP